MDHNLKDEEVVGGGTCDSTSGSLEMEMGSGHQVKLVEAGAVEGSKGQVKTGNLEGKEDETALELERLVMDLHVKGDPQGLAMKVELLSKLEKARVETADRGKAARRLKWKEEVRMELLKREEAKIKMASTPLKKVTDWEAKADMSKMSMEWRKAFKNGRTNFLFSKVFRIIYENADVETKGRLVLPCRRVSKDWNRAAGSCILSVFERDDDNSLEDSSFPAPCKPEVQHCILGVPQLQNLAKMTAFNYWSEHRYRGKNPFLARTLHFVGGVLDWKNNLAYWKGGEILLSRWGAEIWVFLVSFDKGMTFEVMYEQLVKYLKLMPNLRHLEIKDHPRRGSNSMLVTDMMRDLGKDIYSLLKERISRNPLPPLPHLKNMTFEDYVVLPLAQAALAKYSGTLEHVILHDGALGDGDTRALLSERDLTLPHLKGLLVSSYVPTGVHDFSSNCPVLTRFYLLRNNIPEAADLVACFGNLNRLKPISTLRQLTLAVKPTDRVEMLKLSADQLKGLFLDLPQLESFKLEAYHVNLKGIDFLLPCAGLKDLELNYHKVLASGMRPTDKKATKGKRIKEAGAGPHDPGEIIQFFRYTNRLYESNLWRLFPELRLINISVHLWGDGDTPQETATKTTTKVYTRAGFKKHLGDSVTN